VGYDIKKFRSIKHGQSDINAHCRHCDWSCYGSKTLGKARYHATNKLHTVDIYREHHTELTSYFKDTIPNQRGRR